MGTAYGLSNCVGWFRAGLGVYSDAGSTPAGPGAGVQQWNDLSGAGNHLKQASTSYLPVYNAFAGAVAPAGPATVAPYGYTTNVDQPSYPPSVLFDGSSSFMYLPDSATFSATGCTAVVCSRGPYYSPITLGNTAGPFINYGWVGGRPGGMAMRTSISSGFNPPTFLPALQPMVHGFTSSQTRNQTRIYLGTNQTLTTGSHLANFAMTGGAVGATPSYLDPTLGYFFFRGEIFEIVVFNTPLDDAQMATLIGQMQSANGLPPEAGHSQVVFVGDSLTAGGPGIRPLTHCFAARLTRRYGGAIKPLLLAVPGHSIASQQTLVTDQLPGMDKTSFKANVATVCCGSNDVITGRSAGQVSADLAALCQSVRSAGFKVAIATITPRTDNSFGSYAGVFAAVNSTIRANYSAYADALIDWAADPRLSDPANPQYFADLCHTTDAGDAVKTELAKPVLDSFLTAPTVSLSFAKFYSAGSAFAGTYGSFVRG